jgi:hypothetical protein
MSPFNRSLGDLILYTFLNLSEREMETYVKLKIQDFLAKPYTTKELYYFLDGISKLPCTRMGNICVGDISGFMQASADVTKHYEVPSDDEAKMIDLEWCEDQLSKPSQS